MAIISELNQASQNYLVNEANNRTANAGEIRKQDENGGQNVSPVTEEKSSEDIAAKGVYGNVLDISEDGDTVSARTESLAALEDGIVMLKQEPVTPAQNEATSQNSVKEASETKSEKQDVKADTSLVGVSASQMETMYLKGEISRAEYDKEVDRRERLKEDSSENEDESKAETRQNNREFIQDMSAINSSATSEKIEDTGYADAIKNGRANIMLDVFNQAN